MYHIQINESNEVVYWTSQYDSYTDEQKAQIGEVIPVSTGMPEASIAPPGKIAILMYKPEDGTLYYEYRDRPLTTDERVASLEAVVQELILASMS